MKLKELSRLMKIKKKTQKIKKVVLHRGFKLYELLEIYTDQINKLRTRWKEKVKNLSKKLKILNI